MPNDGQNRSLRSLFLAIVRRVPPGAVRCRSLRSRHRPSPGLRRSLKFAKSLRQENASIFYDSGTSQTRRTLCDIADWGDSKWGKKIYFGTRKKYKTISKMVYVSL